MDIWTIAASLVAGLAVVLIKLRLWKDDFTAAHVVLYSGAVAIAAFAMNLAVGNSMAAAVGWAITFALLAILDAFFDIFGSLT